MDSPLPGRSRAFWTRRLQPRSRIPKNMESIPWGTSHVLCIQVAQTLRSNDLKWPYEHPSGASKVGLASLRKPELGEFMSS